ncbi:MAG TPA: hypothetical protein PKJ77_05460, partial [Thermodesulfobacteriota bacterium]|nr:hypothetical protein [Thermodesulfobacteriota bacterium]
GITVGPAEAISDSRITLFNSRTLPGQWCLSNNSSASFEIDCTAVPLSAALQAGAALCKEDALELALTGGEDFELLFSAAPEQRDAINQVEQECMCPITRIGRLSQHSSGIVILDRSGAKRTLGAAGFDHFKKTMREHGE